MDHRGVFTVGIRATEISHRHEHAKIDSIHKQHIIHHTVVFCHHRRRNKLRPSLTVKVYFSLKFDLRCPDNAMGLSDISKGQDGEIIRDYEPVEGVEWRFGSPPDYATVNAAYFEGRTKVHPPGSLESVVQKAVKNWEVESHHIEVRAPCFVCGRHILYGRRKMSPRGVRRFGKIHSTPVKYIWYV